MGKDLPKRVLNVSGAKGPALECMKKVIGKVKGWKLGEKQDAQHDDVYFIIQREWLHKRIERMGETSFVSKFPGMHSLCEKVIFTKAMNYAVSMMPDGCAAVRADWG